MPMPDFTQGHISAQARVLGHVIIPHGSSTAQDEDIAWHVKEF